MYLVTGATGNVGSEVVEQLLTRGEHVRVFTRNAGKVTRWGNRVEVVVGDFENPATFARALADVNAAFLMTQTSDVQQFQQLIDAAESEGRPKIIFLSTLAVSMPESLIGKIHKEKEDAIRESGLEGTFIRPGGFMSNAYRWIGSIKNEGVVYNGMGAGKFAPIAPQDIAAVAVKALTASNGSGEVFELTGGEYVTVPEQVNLLADILRKPIRCVDLPAEALVQYMMRDGLPAHVAAAVAQSYEAVRNGHAATMMTGTVESVTGRPPKTFAAWARENAARFA